MKFFLTVSALFFFCYNGISQETEKFNDNHPGVHKIKIKEVVQTTNYTYLNADDNGRLIWIAVPKTDAKTGESYYFQGGMEMVDFKSKELDRTFESVIFLNGLISPEIVEGGKTVLNQTQQMSKSTDEKIDIKIDPAKGGITIQQLFSEQAKYANKVVKIRGKVTKYNSKIMGRNWFHLQDGTGNSGEYDLTVTTENEVNVGDVITVEGIISLDKDFGAGYFYHLIMENGLVVE